MYNSKLSLMETKKDYQNRLPEHPEPLELGAYEEKATPVPPVEEPQMAHAAIDRHNRRGGGFLGWAWLTVLAIGVLVGSIYWFSDHDKDTDSLYASQNLQGTSVYGKADASDIQQGQPMAVKTSLSTTDVTKTDASAVPHDVVYLFPLDGSEIPDDATLNDLAKKVAASGAYVSVVAYTDESGNAEYNQRLSERRAKRVGEYLIAHGVPSDHVRTKGMGQTHAYPSAAQDRRAEIHVSV